MRAFGFLGPTAAWLLLLAFTVGGLTSVASAQETRPPIRPRQKNNGQSKAQIVPASDLAARKRFVLDVVRSAVALPQADEQDRLRVLVSAAKLAAAVSPDMARSLNTEGMEIERNLLASGQQPAVSMLQMGLADCLASVAFLDAMPVESLSSSEPSIIAVLQKCPRAALPLVQRKLEYAEQQGIAAPRALLAAMEANGTRSTWSQQQFESVFSSLPDPAYHSADAVNYAAIYERFSSIVDKGTAREAGLRLIAWLGKMPASPSRVQALTSVSAAIQKALGEEQYREALRSDVIALQTVEGAGHSFEITPPDEGTAVSVLRATNYRQDHTDALQQLGPAQKARQAAAYGFAAAQAGDEAAAARYFDTAFAAIEDAWALRGPRLNAVAVVEEISSAAGHSDPIAALARAQRLQDAAARAISMLAVAQAVLTRQNMPHPAAASASASTR